MKVAMIGTGKTGSEVKAVLGDENLHDVYNRSNPPTVEKLKGADIAIIFVPGDAAADLFDIIIDAHIPAVWGTTGCTYPDHLDTNLRENSCTWIIGENFSLSMSIMRHLLRNVGMMSRILTNPSFKITETHHTNKKDAPSGTALAWERWLGHTVEMESIREGDVVGRHVLEIETNNETITLAHDAKARRCFAEGAVWAAQQIVEKNFTKPGLHRFEDVIDSQLAVSDPALRM